MLRRCLACGADFEGDPGAVKCPACAETSRRSVLRDRTCRTCGAVFLGGPRAWYCPECRTERRQAQSRAYKRRAAAGGGRPLGSTDLCVVCGKPYTVKSGNQQYCPACAPEAVREIDHAQGRAWNAANSPPEARREARSAAKAPIPCAICGEPFVPHGVQTLCSDGCRREALRRARARADAKRRGRPRKKAK